jgi:hypothetical protein
MNAWAESQNNPRLFSLASSPLHWLQPTSHLPRITGQLKEQCSYINKHQGESFMKYFWHDNKVGLSFFVLGDSSFLINAFVDLFAKFYKYDQNLDVFNNIIYIYIYCGM